MELMETLQGYLAWVGTWVGSKWFQQNKSVLQPMLCDESQHLTPQLHLFVVSLISDGRIHEDHCDEVWNTMQAHGITKPTGIQCRRGLFETVVAWWQQDHRLVGGAG